MNSYGLQPFLRVVNRRTFIRFLENSRVSKFWTKLVWNFADPHGFRFVNVLEYEEASFLIITWFYSEIWFESSEIFGLILFFTDSSWNPEINRWFFLFFFSISPSVIAFEFAASGSELALELQGKTFQWWRSKIESLRTAMDFTVFAWIWFWKKAKVCSSCSWIFLSFLDFDSN